MVLWCKPNPTQYVHFTRTPRTTEEISNTVLEPKPGKNGDGERDQRQLQEDPEKDSLRLVAKSET